MPTIRRIDPPKPPEPALRPGQAKLCDSLGEWRPDEPDLWPWCGRCQAPIKTGDRYAVAYPCRVLCSACSGLTVPAPKQSRDLQARPERISVVGL